MNKLLNIASWVVTFFGIIALLGFVEKKTAELQCGDLYINIDRAHNNYFVLDEDITEIFNNHGYHKNQLVDSFDIRQMEMLLNKYPGVQQADVYATVDGNLMVDVIQRKPLVRIFNKKGESFYIDEEGWVMPWSRKYTARVMVANGNITSVYGKSIHRNWATSFNMDSIQSDLSSIYRIAKYISKDQFWKAQIIQLYLNEKGDVEMIPRVGNHTIILGDAQDLETKFNKLMVFYRKGLSKTGWNEYKTINLKYKNQVVCKKQ